MKLNSYHFNYISCISNKNEIENAVINDVIDKIENFYEVKNNTTYGELINSLRLKDYNQIFDHHHIHLSAKYNLSYQLLEIMCNTRLGYLFYLYLF